MCGDIGHEVQESSRLNSVSHPKFPSFSHPTFSFALRQAQSDGGCLLKSHFVGKYRDTYSGPHRAYSMEWCLPSSRSEAGGRRTPVDLARTRNETLDGRWPGLFLVARGSPLRARVSLLPME